MGMKVEYGEQVLKWTPYVWEKNADDEGSIEIVLMGAGRASIKVGF